MASGAWTRVERAFTRGLKSETGPPYFSVWATDSQMGTIPADFEKSIYPGLIFLHFVRNLRADTSPTVVAYWTSEGSFAAARAQLTRELSLGPLLSSGLASDVRLGGRTFWQSLRRLSLREALIAVSAVVGALVLLLNFAGDASSYLFAAPRIDVVPPGKPVDVVEGASLLLPVKIRSRLASRNIELKIDDSDPLRLEPVKPSDPSASSKVHGPTPVRLTVEGGQPPLVPAGQTIDLNLRLAPGELPNPRSVPLPKANASDPRPDHFQLKGRLLASRDGWIWGPRPYSMPLVGVRIWSKIQCTQGIELNTQLDKGAAAKVAFTGRIYAGEAREAVKLYVEARGAKDLSVSGADGDRPISQDQSWDGSTKFLDWTRSVRSFEVSTFWVVLESKEARTAEDWRTIGSRISIVCS